MIKLVEKILSHTFEGVKSSGVVIDLFRCYSTLYNGGKQCRTCVKSQEKYYNQLKKDGIMKAINYEEAKNRTCKPKFKGLKCIRGTHQHFNSDHITDKQAIYFLENGMLSENDFEKLPIDWINRDKNIEIAKEIQNEIMATDIQDEVNSIDNNAEQKCILEFAELLKQGLSKTKIKDKYKNVEFIGAEKCTTKYISELIKKAEAI